MDGAYLMLKRKSVKVMLPCVIEFQRENAYLSSSGSPMNDKRTLGASAIQSSERQFGGIG